MRLKEEKPMKTNFLTTEQIKSCQEFFAAYDTFGIIQAENPDADSLGSALALGEILENQDRQVSHYCPVNLPKYIRYFADWSKVSDDFDLKADAYIIVDTSSQILLSKLWQDPLIKNALISKPVLVIDHHAEFTPDLEFEATIINQEAAATAVLLTELCEALEFKITPTASQYLLGAIMSDTLGLTTPNVDSRLLRLTAKLLDYGANIANLEQDRRELAKKSIEILDYKADLIKRIEYHLDDKLALIHIPFDEIREYSDQYNPSMLVLDEMRMVEGVEIAIAIKTYPDQRLTGKVRTNLPIANQVAGYFGGGGHAFAAGFRIYQDYEPTLVELIKAVEQILTEYYT